MLNPVKRVSNHPKSIVSGDSAPGPRWGAYSAPQTPSWVDAGGFAPCTPLAGFRQLQFHHARHLFPQKGSMSPLQPMYVNIPRYYK